MALRKGVKCSLYPINIIHYWRNDVYFSLNSY